MFKNVSLRKPQFLLLIAIISVSSCSHHSVSPEHQAIHRIIAKANTDFYLDQRMWFQDVHASIEGQTVTLKGEAFFKIPVHGIQRKLKRAGYDYTLIDSVHYLPQNFPDDLAFGIVIEPYVMGRYKPVEKKQEGTEMLYGEPVRLIREEGDYLQVQSNIGYLGYIKKESVRRVNLAEWSHYHLGKQAIFNHSVQLEKGAVIPMGTRLPYLGKDMILLADGSQMTLSEEYFETFDPASNPLRESIIQSAQAYLGLPYVWGGRSADGVDCSGFVMQSYALNNLYLPRDSDEIANMGRIIGLPGWMDAMLPGDLMFFAGGKRMVTHTAIYMGEGKVIHSLGEGVQIQSMNPNDPDYSESLDRRFIFAKRIFD